MKRPSFLEHQDYRYLWLSAFLTLAAVLGYWAAMPAGGAAWGGSWYGYLSGCTAMALVVIHMWYGVRKRIPPRVPERRKGERRRKADDARRRQDRRRTPAEDSWRYGGTLRGWLSAHVYLGVPMVVMATLHAGFRVGWNLPTLAYLMLVALVASGIYGTFAYLHYPPLISDNLGKETLNDLWRRMAELDRQAGEKAAGLPDEVGGLVAVATRETRIGGSLLEQLGLWPADCPTGRAVRRLEELARELVDGDQPLRIRELYAMLVQRQRLVARVRRDVVLHARMQGWTYLHVPLAIALPAALFGHVAAILIYW